MTTPTRFYWSWNRATTKAHLWRSGSPRPLCGNAVAFTNTGPEYKPNAPPNAYHCADCARIADALTPEDTPAA